MTDDQFNKLMARLDGIQADVETGFATVHATLGTLAVGQINLFNMLLSHTADRGAHGKAA